jgi:acyl-CoA oxidase
MRVWTAIKQMTARAGSAVTDLNPVTTRKTDVEHLRDPDFHAAALAFREDRLLRSVAGRLQYRISRGMDAFDAMNECQDHLIKLGRAHAERIALESFQSRVKRCSTAGLHAVLTRLCGLYALSVLAADRAWFLESGYFEPAKSKAVRDQVNELCGELKDSAVALTNGWGIPERYLPAIAR